MTAGDPMSPLEKPSNRARSLAAALEPFAGQVYFSPECHRNYEALGFGGSPTTVGDVAMPDGSAYFTSRGSVLGQVPGEVVAAAFGVFDPRVVIRAVAAGWARTDAATICEARTEGAVAQLRRILGAEPDGVHRAVALLRRATDHLGPAGKPLFAGLVAQGEPDSALGRAWRSADQLREYRGDAHVAAWTLAGFDGCEISLLTELYWGLPLRSYSRSRGWSDDSFAAAEDRLVAAGLIADGRLTDRGRAERDAVEVATDRACRPIVGALGADLDELVQLLSTWSRRIREDHGYPVSGPHELAEALRARHHIERAR
jgi:hypothetical protein